MEQVAKHLKHSNQLQEVAQVLQKKTSLGTADIEACKLAAMTVEEATVVHELLTKALAQIYSTEPPINDALKLGEGAGWFTKTVTAVTARDEEDRISREAYPDDNHESPEHVPRRSTRRSQERPRDVNAFATTDPNGNTGRRHMDGRRPTENRRPPPSATDQRRLAEDKSPRRKSSRAVPSA